MVLLSSMFWYLAAVVLGVIGFVTDLDTGALICLGVAVILHKIESQ